MPDLTIGEWNKTRPVPFFRVRHEKPEPRYRVIPVFLMLIGVVIFTRMSPSLFLKK